MGEGAGTWVLPLLWSLMKYPSEASETGWLVSLCPHSKGTHCLSLGTCSGLLLGTSIASPQDIHAAIFRDVLSNTRCR